MRSSLSVCLDFSHVLCLQCTFAWKFYSCALSILLMIGSGDEVFGLLDDLIFEMLKDVGVGRENVIHF